MATMRSGLETWLRQDCYDAGINLLGSGEAVKHWVNTAISEERIELLVNAKDYILHDMYQPNADQMVMISRMLDNIANYIRSRDGKATSEAYKLVDYYKTIAIERVVECQCGKLSPQEKELGTIFPEHGKVVKYIDSKGLEVELRAIPNWNEYEDTEEGQRGYHEDSAAWESHMGDTSVLEARMVDDVKAKEGPCTCTAGKEICWHKGFQGTLSKAQKEKFCAGDNWKAIGQGGKK